MIYKTKPKGERIVGVTDSTGIIFPGQCRGETTINGLAEVAEVIIIGSIVDGWVEEVDGWVEVVDGWVELVDGGWVEVVVVEIVEDAWGEVVVVEVVEDVQSKIVLDGWVKVVVVDSSEHLG
ncbi:hypothetical protein F8M41_019891 [Gigaspora margarita]|uniref:Uncharacterized protein n=1 Tax=Gigaspora margarita TaxID=4874 RepID=A0A8H4AJ84_GIGMA|nr:hypothetical protein F8M41_019891 [Gigaspora margarita]